MEKIKDWIKEHKGLFAAICGLVVAGIYYLYKRNSSRGDSDSSMATMGYAPSAGSDGSGGSVADSGNELSGIDTLIKENNEAQQAGQIDFLSGLTDIFSRFTDTLQTPGASQPNVPMPTAQQMGEEPLSAGTMFQAATADILGGSGGGMVYGTQKQIAALASGSSKNTGGSYRIDASDWTPSTSKSSRSKGSNAYSNAKVTKITGGSGTVERQLSGKTQAEKTSILKKAGLI